MYVGTGYAVESLQRWLTLLFLSWLSRSGLCSLQDFFDWNMGIMLWVVLAASHRVFLGTGIKCVLASSLQYLGYCLSKGLESR